MYAGNGNIFHAVPNKGVIEEKLSTYLDNKSYIVIINIPGLSETEEQTLSKKIKSMIGGKYSYRKAIWLGILIFNNHVRGYRIILSLDFFVILSLLSYLLSAYSSVVIILSIIFIIHMVFVVRGYVKRCLKAHSIDNYIRLLKHREALQSLRDNCNKNNSSSDSHP